MSRKKKTKKSTEPKRKLRQAVFQVRDFTSKKGEKVKMDVKSNQTFKRFKAALRSDSLLPNLMNRLIKNLDIKVCVLSQTYQRLTILTFYTTYGFF